jgi:hypothetical protein
MKTLYLIFLLYILTSCSKEIPERYYRLNNEKYSNETAELTMTQYDFEIKIFEEYHKKHVGRLNGKLNHFTTPAHSGIDYYYSIIKNYYGEYSNRKDNCIVIFIKDEYGITVIVEGGIPNLYSGEFTYAGRYLNSVNIELDEDEDILLKNIFLDKYDVEDIKNLLGINMKYFLEIFQTYKIIREDEVIIIDGWIPGGNKYTNGIIQIKNDHIYILFGDIRIREGIEYNYFTNDSIIEDFPIEIKEWARFPNDVKINIIKK